MPRHDISIDARYGEAEFTEQLTGKAVYGFSLLQDEGGTSEQFCYGEIRVPWGFRFLSDKNRSRGLYVRIDYEAVYKPLCVRLRQDTGWGGHEYVMNPVTRGTWYPIYEESDEGHCEPIQLSAFLRIQAEGNFYLLLRDGYFVVYSGAETDFVIRPSKSQNEIFLLKAAAGNLYSYPTTGVGLINYLHSNLERNDLSIKLQTEFTNDNLIIQNAYIDSTTGELLLDTLEKEVSSYG